MRSLAQRARRGWAVGRHRLRTEWCRRWPYRVEGGHFGLAGLPARLSAKIIPAPTTSAQSLTRAQIRKLRSAQWVEAAEPLTPDMQTVLSAAGAVVSSRETTERAQHENGGSQGRSYESTVESREMLGAELRRNAWSSLRPKRSISVLLASNRPDQIDHVTVQLRRQQHTDFQLVAGCHGPAWTDADLARLDQTFPGSSIRRYSSEMTLGAVLNSLLAQSDCDVVTKLDDDDYYGRHHLDDLLNALAASEADLVGKPAAFVYLAGSDLTVRRPMSSECFSTSVAGGTMTMSRDRLAELGGFPNAPRHVDRLVFDRLHRAGGWSYRTHPFGFVLNRQAGPHTWNASDAYFVEAAVSSRPGLDLLWAGVHP